MLEIYCHRTSSLQRQLTYYIFFFCALQLVTRSQLLQCALFLAHQPVLLPAGTLAAKWVTNRPSTSPLPRPCQFQPLVPILVPAAARRSDVPRLVVTHYTTRHLTATVNVITHQSQRGEQRNITSFTNTT